MSQVDRAYVYRPAHPKRQVIGAMVREFVNKDGTTEWATGRGDD